VLTTLRKSAADDRFRTGDIVSFTSRPALRRTSIRMRGVHGVSTTCSSSRDQHFPSDVERWCAAMTHTGEYRLVVERFGHLDQLTVNSSAHMVPPSR